MNDKRKTDRKQSKNGNNQVHFQGRYVNLEKEAHIIVSLDSTQGTRNHDNARVTCLTEVHLVHTKDPVHTSIAAR